MKKNKSCWLATSISKLCNIDYRGKAKFLILIPVLLIALAIMFTSIFGLNLHSDVRDRYEFVVDFGVEIESDKESIYRDKIDEALKNNDLSTVKYTKYGQGGIFSGLQITIDPSITDFTSEDLEELQETLEADLQVSIATTVDVSDISLVKTDLSGTTISALIAFAVVLVLLFAYVWIRFNISTALSAIILALISSGLTFVIYGLFRLPFGISGCAVIFVGMIISEIIYIYISDYIRNKEIDNQSMTNNEYISTANKSLLNTVILPIIAISAFAILLAIIMLFINTAIATTLFALVFALIVAVYSGMFVSSAFWANIYNKTKDYRLRNRIDRQTKLKTKKEKKSEKDSDDKIVV